MAVKRRACCFSLPLLLAFLAVLAESLSIPLTAAGADNLSSSNLFEAAIARLWKELPAPQTHFIGIAEGAANEQRRGQNYQAFLQEKVQDRWFAALVSP